ncbi:MAG: hypothetical protein IMZ53_00850 [Thermoplasmata archaeon]|nr:hypothetical protein [Thermoplasmata archaeon]
MGIEENITPGKILYLYVDLPPDYEYDNKYMVVVCEDPLLLLKINTSGEQTAMGRKFNERQFTIKKSIYTFLMYDSYIDCGTVWYGIISKDEAIVQLAEDSSRIKGELIPDHRNELIRLTGQSRSISTTHKRIIAERCR